MAEGYRAPVGAEGRGPRGRGGSWDEPGRSARAALTIEWREPRPGVIQACAARRR